MTPEPRLLYLHGFASGPNSTKGVALARHLGARGVALARLDLRLPSFAHLRVSAMVDAVRAALGGEADGAVLLGSSLGAYVAARVAALDARVRGLFLLAPAFNLAPRWRARLGEEGMRRWHDSGWLETHDYTTGRPAQVDYGFFADLEAQPLYPEARVPTLVIHGLRDDVVDISSSRAFVAARPEARLIEVDDGHELAGSLPRILQEAERFLAPFAPRLSP